MHNADMTDSSLRARAARRFAALLALTLIAGALVSCSKTAEEPRREVVLYYSADEFVARPIIEAFEEETGIRVLALGDTEATKTTGLFQRLRSEKSAPRADVFWSSEIFMTEQLAREGVLAPHESESVADWPDSLRDPDRLWHAFGLRSRVLVYSTERISPEDVPQTMHDLLNPRFKGRIAIARPAFGTTRGHVAALVAMWGEDVTREWIKSMRENEVTLLDGNSTVVRDVARGRVDIGLTDTDDVWSGQREGWPVDLVYIRHDLPDDVGDYQAGPLLIPNTVARIKGGPNPDAAAMLIDYLLSERVERMLAESDSHNIPVRPKLKEEFSEYAVEDPATVPYSDVVDAMETGTRLHDHFRR